MKKDLPIFIFNGFLDSGKTKLMKEILESDEVYHNGRTLVLMTEEGIEELDGPFKHQYGLNVEVCLDEEKLTQEYVDSLVKKYKPKQVFVELNAFFDFSKLPLPKNGVIYQMVTTIDSSTFEMYYNNMKQLFNNMVKNSTIIIFNRAVEDKKLGNYRRMVRAFNQGAQIGFEGEDGKLRTTLDEDLPYDIESDHIVLKEEDYPIWYLDVFDNYEKYFGKKITMETFVRDILEDALVVGRRIMTCCEADIQFYGFECLTDAMVKNNSYIKLTCHVIYEFSKLAQEEVVKLVADEIEVLSPKIEQYLTFN